MVIQLLVRSLVDLDALEAGVALHLIRITAAVSILTPAGWSPAREGILDTGNPVSLIPQSAWAGATVAFLGARSRAIHGLGSTEQSAIRGRLGRLIITIGDQEASSAPIEIIA